MVDHSSSIDNFFTDIPTVCAVRHKLSLNNTNNCTQDIHELPAANTFSFTSYTMHRC